MKYDIFISYRREGGRQYARILQLMLQQRGYKVFLDYDELVDGIFNDKIKEAVTNSDIFMIVLSSGSLDRCVNIDDSVRNEIQLAMDSKKKIIPVNPDNAFGKMPADIPQDIIDYVSYNQYSDIQFGQTLGISVNFMVEKRIVPYIGKREITHHVDNDFDNAKATLDKKWIKDRRVKKCIWAALSVLSIILAVGMMFFIYYSRQNKLEIMKHDVEARYQCFDMKLNPNITLSQTKTIDDILGNMTVVAPDSLWMSQFECRVVDWHGIVGGKYDKSQELMPITNVSFGDCQLRFLDKLRELTGLDYDAHYCIDIPTADEWEFAASGGFEKENTIYAGSDNADEVAWYRDNSDGKVHPSDGRQGKLCNNRDIFDLSGNVAEWTSSPYLASDDAALWTVCGGNYTSREADVTVTSRAGIDSNTRNDKTGFRIIIRKQ